MAEAASIESVEPEASPRRPEEASWTGTLLTWAWVVGNLLFWSVPCIVLGALAILLGDRQRRVAAFTLAACYRTITRFHPMYKRSLTGVENLGGGPYLICPNHQSLADVVYLFVLPGHYKWIVKRELFWVPLFGICMRLAGYPAIRRGDVDSANDVLEQVSRYLDQGVNVLNFPEGSRSRSGEIGRFQTGAARMAIMNQVPLVPVGVVGTARLLPRGSAMYPWRAHLALHVGKPIPTEGLTLKDLRPLTQQLRDAVIAAKAVAQRRVDEEPG